MEKVDMVIVGAEGVVESGGIINKVSALERVECLMAKWLGLRFQGHEVYCPDLEFMASKTPVGSNFGCIVLLSKSYLKQKNIEYSNIEYQWRARPE